MHEENEWTPFFHDDEFPHRSPGSHFHLVHSLQPLQTTRCRLLHGHCDWVYQQDLPDSVIHPKSHPSARDSMHGGNNFALLHQSDLEVNLWV